MQGEPFAPRFVIASFRWQDGKSQLRESLLNPRSNLLALTKSKLVFMRQYYVYIMTKKYYNVFYVGMTNNLVRRVHEHKEKAVEGFTKRYSLAKLVYYEVAETASAAIAREKQLKGGSRQDKISLIKGMNPKWIDLFDTIV